MTTLTLASTAESISQIEPFVDEVREKFEISDDIFGNILVSLSEAVNNAIFHGNDEDASKQVTIICKKDTEKEIISFKVIDEGPGFDYNNLPDPTSPENLENLSGRGVFLMKQLADMVIFSDNGSTVEIQFKV
ncbi:MAG: ATP-binding protein [Chitinophagales bacterium]|nr:ATP-binding protein [Chitinophagales bacterium]